MKIVLKGAMRPSSAFFRCLTHGITKIIEWRIVIFYTGKNMHGVVFVFYVYFCLCAVYQNHA